MMDASACIANFSTSSAHVFTFDESDGLLGLTSAIGDVTDDRCIGIHCQFQQSCEL